MTQQAGLAIAAAGITRRFGDFTAVDNVDLQVRQGELFSLLGPNGAGKTTFISMMCGLLLPSGGTAVVAGHDVAAAPVAVKARIGVSPQETAVAGRLSARENLALVAGLHGMDSAAAGDRIEELLELMALGERGREQARKYSGGMKRRLSIAMALVSNPEILFLDEPTLGLDPQARRAMWEYIEGLKGSMTILLTTHYLEEADALADRIAVIDSGRIVAQGTPDELKATIAGVAVTVVEADGVTDEAAAALREAYPVVRVTENGFEIEGDDVRLYDIVDRLRPLGVEMHAGFRRQTTLDDVFLDLTGKELRR